MLFRSSQETHAQGYINVQYIFDAYLKLMINDNTYLQIIKKLRDEVRMQNILLDNQWKRFRLVNENGLLPEGVDGSKLQRVIMKIEDELSFMLRKKTLKKKLSILVQAASWLFAGAPDICIDYIRTEMRRLRSSIPRDILLPAGRSFTREEDIALFFEVAIERIKKDDKKTYWWIYSIVMILQHRSNAPHCLTRENALFLAEFAYRRMRSQLNNTTIKKIFLDSTRLFLYLLRWREVDIFLSEGKEYDLGQKAKKVLEFAKDISDNDNLRKLLDQIEKYIDFQGTSEIIWRLDDD